MEMTLLNPKCITCYIIQISFLIMDQLEVIGAYVMSQRMVF